MTEPAASAVAIHELRKAFGATVAVADVSFAVNAGRCPCAAGRERRRQIDDRQASVWINRARSRDHHSVRRRSATIFAQSSAPVGRSDRLPGNDADTGPNGAGQHAPALRAAGMDRHDPPTPGGAGSSRAFRRSGPRRRTLARGRPARSRSPAKNRNRTCHFSQAAPPFT